MAIGQIVNWKGKAYSVSGYATRDGQLFILWLLNEAGAEIRLTGKELREVAR